MKKKKNKAKSFSWLDIPGAIWYFLEEDKKKVSFYFSVMLLAFFYDLVPPYIVGKIVDFFTNFTAGQSLKPFYFYVIFVGTTWIVSSMIRLKSHKVLSIASKKARARARVWGFERLTEFSLGWHNKENTGNKFQRIFTGAEAIEKWVLILRRDLLRI